MLKALHKVSDSYENVSEAPYAELTGSSLSLQRISKILYDY